MAFLLLARAVREGSVALTAFFHSLQKKKKKTGAKDGAAPPSAHTSGQSKQELDARWAQTSLQPPVCTLPDARPSSWDGGKSWC